MIDRAQRIALHEASHAVVARRLGLPRCGLASIIEPDARALFANDCGFRSIYTLMAGAAAEVVALGDYDRVGVKIEGSDITLVAGLVPNRWLRCP
jgi:hypothetical protein